MHGTLLVTAALSGLAVVLVTWVAGRLGGTAGGLLATAPVTTTAALLYLGMDAGTAASALAALQGGRALAAALVAMPAYFFVLKATPSRSLATRLTAAFAVFLAIFTLGTLLLARVPLPGVAWPFIDLALAGFMGLWFLPQAFPAARDRIPRAGMRWYEMPLRFAAGAAVVLLVGGLRAVNPLLASAWAVFPGTFLVSLLVLGIERGAAWSARAAQGGVLGVPPLVAYLMVLYALLPLQTHAAWPWMVQVPAWAAYFAALIPLWRWRQGHRTSSPQPS